MIGNSIFLGGWKHGKKGEQLFRPAGLCAGGGRKRRGHWQFVALSLSGGQGRRRAVPDRLSGAGADLRLYAAHVGHRHRAAHAGERHPRLRQNQFEVEVSGNTDLPCAGAHHDLLRGYRRLGDEICADLRHRSGRGRGAGRLFHVVHHVAGRAGGVRASVHGGYVADRL